MQLPYSWERKEWKFLIFLMLCLVVTLIAKNVFYYSSSNTLRIARAQFLSLSPADQQYYRAMYAYAEANETEYERLRLHSSLFNAVAKSRYYHNAVNLYQRLASAGNTNAILNLWSMVGNQVNNAESSNALTSLLPSGADNNTFMGNVIGAEHGNLDAILALHKMYSDAGLHVAAYTWGMVLHQLSNGKYAAPSVDGLSSNDQNVAQANIQTLLQYISQHP